MSRVRTLLATGQGKDDTQKDIPYCELNNKKKKPVLRNERGHICLSLSPNARTDTHGQFFATISLRFLRYDAIKIPKLIVPSDQSIASHTHTRQFRTFGNSLSFLLFPGLESDCFISSEKQFACNHTDNFLFLFDLGTAAAVVAVGNSTTTRYYWPQRAAIDNLVGGNRADNDKCHLRAIRWHS